MMTTPTTNTYSAPMPTSVSVVCVVCVPDESLPSPPPTTCMQTDGVAAVISEMYPFIFVVCTASVLFLLSKESFVFLVANLRTTEGHTTRQKQGGFRAWWHPTQQSICASAETCLYNHMHTY